jgi:hypothetical protein
VGAGAGEGAEVYVVIVSPPNFWDLDEVWLVLWDFLVVGKICRVWDCENGGEIAGC